MLRSIITLLLALSPLIASAQSLEDQLRDAEQQLAAALVAKDAGAFERLLAPAFVLRGAPDVPREQWISNALSMCWGDRFEISSFSASGQTDQIAVVSLLMTTAQDPVTCEPAVIRSLITDVWVRQGTEWHLALLTPHRRRLRWPGSSKRLSLRRLGGKDPPSCRWLPPAAIPIHRRSAPWRRSHGGRGPGPRKVAPRSCAAPPTMPSPPNR